MKDLFLSFTGGQNEMDGKTFAKMSKDTKMLNKVLTTTDIDLIFAKIRDKEARKINYAQFVKGVELCATKRGETAEQLEANILATGGPSYTGTKAEAVKYHDDKSLYTGVYANGGPTTAGGSGGISDISQLCDRSAADVRGIKK